MVTFYEFPEQRWRHMGTTNPVKSPFASVRLRTRAGNATSASRVHCSDLASVHGRGETLSQTPRARPFWNMFLTNTASSVHKVRSVPYHRFYGPMTAYRNHILTIDVDLMAG